MANETLDIKPYYPEAIKPQKVTGSHHYVVVPEGHTLADLRPFWSEPLRLKTDPVFHRIEDFAQYLKTFRMEKEIGREPAYAPPMVWADLQDMTMEAVLDHPGSFWNKEHSWQDHTAQFHPQIDPHWKIWEANDNAVSDKKFNQAEFLEFLQANRWDIVDPPAARLLEVCNNLEMTRGGVFKAGVRNQTGEFNFEVVENHQNVRVQVPSEFTLSLNPFRFGEPQALSVRLYYRIVDGALRFYYRRERPEQIVEAVFEEWEDRIKLVVGVEVMYGRSRTAEVVL